MNISTDKLYADIGARMRNLRETLKLTQAQVAEMAGIDASFYGQVERGADIPSLKTFLAVAAALNADPADLLPSPKDLKRGARPGNAVRPENSRVSQRSAALSSTAQQPAPDSITQSTS